MISGVVLECNCLCVRMHMFICLPPDTLFVQQQRVNLQAALLCRVLSSIMAASTDETAPRSITASLMQHYLKWLFFTG